MSETVGQDVYKKIYLDAEQKVSDAVRELQSLSEELTNKADTQIVPKLRLPESWEQHTYGMSMADVYEETLRGLPDDVKVEVTYRHPAYVTNDNVVEVKSVSVEKRCLMWTDNMLMITRFKGDMGNYEITRYRGYANEEREEHPKNVSDNMPEAYTTLVPMSNVMAVDVAWEVNLDEMRRENQDRHNRNYWLDETGAEELDLGEQDWESMFSDPEPFESESMPDASPERIGIARISGNASETSSPLSAGSSPDGRETENEDVPEWPACGAISSYNDNGTFENCFHLRSMTKARSEASFRLPPVSEDYRSQLEPRFGKVATMTGTLVGTVRYDSCIRLVLDDMELSLGKNMTEPMEHICLFVSRDYRVPATGSRLKVKGFVYAYSPSQTGGTRRQLGINAITLRTLS